MSQAVYEKIRDKYKQVCESSNPRPDKYIARVITEAIGLIDPKTGDHYRRPDGAPMLAKERKRTVADFPLEAITEGLIGHNWRRLIAEGRWFSEENAAPIGPSHLMNVSAWTASVGGLVKGSILEGYESADFDLVDLFPIRPMVYWQGGERYTAIIGPSRPAPRVGPGQSHPDVRLDAMWVEPGAMSKYGHKITVAKETAVTDITGGQVLASARDLGMGLKYRENELALDAIVGQTNNFKLGLTADASATGYNTYGATVPAGPGQTATLGNDIVNPISSDPMTVFNTSQVALLGYRHPVTGLPMPMADRLTTMLLPSSIQWFATYLNTIQNIALGSQPAAPASQIAGSTFPTGWANAPNPFAGIFKNVRVSQWLYNRHIASTTQTDPELSPGLGLTAGVGGTGNRAYRLDPERFACRRMGWDVNVTEINPNGFVMADQNLIFGSVANIAVQVQVLSPWAIQRWKVS